MLDNIKLGQYLQGDSWYYRLDPRNKLVITTLFIVLIFLADNWQTYAIVTFFTMLIVLTSGISLKFFYKSIRPIFFLMFFTFFLNLFFIRTGGVLTTLNPIKVYDITYDISFISLIVFGVITGAIILLSLFNKLPSGLGGKVFKLSLLLFLVLNYTLMFVYSGNETIWAPELTIHKDAVVNGGFIILRLILIISFSSLLTFTTKPTDLTLAIERVLAPLKIIKVPVNELALMISISLRFIPTLLEETQKILKAQTSRGADFSEGNIKDKVIQIISLLIPMFIISFKRAEDLANAMEARGYVPGKKRTSFRELKWQLRDSLFVFSFIIMLALLLYFKY